MSQIKNQDIAIIGMAGRFPEATTISRFYQNLRDGRDCIREFSLKRKKESGLSIYGSYHGMGYQENIDKFDHDYFGISFAEARNMDPHQRFLLETVVECFENAGYDTDHFSGTNTAVYAADINQNYYKLALEYDPTLVTGNLNATAAGRISRVFNLSGTSCMIDTACSSSLVALHLACNSLILGESDHALVTGIYLELFPRERTGKDLPGVFAADDRSKSFSATSDGIGVGEACCCVLLKPLDAALRDGDIIHAVIRGSAVNQDAGRASSLTAPSSVAQGEVIRKAWQRAGVDPLTIAYIEAHGSGTQIGDAMEAEGIKAAFGPFTDRRQFCALSSVKSNIGHTDTAAGISGLIKVVLSLRYGQLFPSLHYEEPNPLMDFINSPAYVNHSLMQWDAGSGEKRRAGVSSIGLSGTNCHVVLEEAPAQAPRASHNPSKNLLVTVTSKTRDGLYRNLESLKSFAAQTEISFGDFCYTLNAGRKHHRHRLAFTAASLAEFVEKANRREMEESHSQPSAGRELWFVFADDCQVTPAIIDAYAARFNSFNEAVNKCRPHADMSNAGEATLRFIFQLGLFGLLADLGISTRKLLSTGSAKLAVEVINKRLTPEEAFVKLKDYKAEPGENLEQNMLRFIKSNIKEEGAIVLEIGFFGEMARIFATHAQKTEVLALTPQNPHDAVTAVLKKLFLSGVSINWKKFYEPLDVRRAELPAYVFEPKRCWFDERKGTFAQDNMYGLAWQESAGVAVNTSAAPRTYLILWNGSGPGAALAKTLRAGGNTCICVSGGEAFEKQNDQSYTIRWNNFEDYEKLSNEIASSAVAVNAVLHLGACNVSALDNKNVEQALSASLYSYFYFTKAFHNLLESRDVFFSIITANGRRITGSEARHFALGAAPHGFLINLPLEYPKTTCRCIDVDLASGISDDAVAVLISEELKVESSVMTVGLRDGRRYVPKIEKMRPPVSKAGTPVVQEGGAYIITGGASGIGLEVLKYLATSASIKAIVLGRRMLPPRGEWQRILGDPASPFYAAVKEFCAVSELGSEVAYYAVNLADRAALAKALADARQKFGSIRGIIHSAGMPGTIRLRRHTLGTFREVLESKIHGSINLLEECTADKPDFFFSFSSENAILPADKSANYSAATLFQDNFIADIAARNISAMSVNWPAWRETGLWHRFAQYTTPTEKEIAETITTEEGIQVLDLVLKNRIPNAIVSKVDPNGFGPNPYFATDGSITVQGVVSKQKPVEVMELEEKELQIVHENNPDWTDIENGVAGIWKAVLKLDEVSLESDFFELGGHSLIGVKVLNRVEKDFGVELEFGDLMDSDDLRSFAKRIADLMAKPVAGYAPLVKAAEQELYDLSPAQSRLWLHCQSHRNQVAYNLFGSYILKGSLDEPALEKAFGALAQRHESLRTVYSPGDGLPKQRVMPAGSRSFGFVSLNLQNEDDRDEKLRTLIEAETARPMDLENGPLMRCFLVHLEEGRHVIFYVVHHIAADGWSIGILTMELFQLYNAFSKGAPDPLPPLKFQYKDFSEWQNALLRSDLISRQRDFWLKEFSGSLPVLNLPLDFERPAVQSFEGARWFFEADGSLAAGLRSLCAQEGATLFTALLAVYNVFIAKLSGQEDIIIGTVSAGRGHAGIEQTVGMFVNTLALRNYPKKEMSFREFMRGVTRRTVEAFDNQHYQFEDLVRALGRKDTSRNPLFDVLFEINNFDEESTAMNGVSTEYLPQETKTIEFDLILNAEEKKGALAFIFQYSTRLFKADSIRLFSRLFIQLLTQVVDNPDQSIADLDLTGGGRKDGQAALKSGKATAGGDNEDNKLETSINFKF